MRIIIIIVLNLICVSAFTQPPVEWNRCYGGNGDEMNHKIIQTPDSGFVFAGSTTSVDGDVSSLTGGSFDFWLVKVDKNGVIEWEHTYGGSSIEHAHTVVQTADNGFIFAGRSTSNDIQVSINYGQQDYWVVKTDSVGNLQWQTSLGGAGYDNPRDIIQNSDGDYLIFGNTSSINTGMVTGMHGGSDYWLVKLDSMGSLITQKCYGGTGIERGFQILQLNNGNYVLFGISNLANGDVSGNNGGFDYWLVMIDSSLNIITEKNYGGSNADGDILSDIATHLVPTNDNGFIFFGGSLSSDGDLTQNYGNADTWLVKLDSAGTIQWQKSYGGSLFDFGNSVVQESDGSFFLLASSASSDFDVTSNQGNYDFWLLHVDSIGNIIWQKSYGGSGMEISTTAIIPIAGGYLVNGSTLSPNGDVTGWNGRWGNEDIWWLKLSQDSTTNISEIASEFISVFPNPVSDYIYIKDFSGGDLKILNLLGQIVFEEFLTKSDYKEYKINVRDLNPGYYIIIVGNKPTSFVKID